MGHANSSRGDRLEGSIAAADAFLATTDSLGRDGAHARHETNPQPLSTLAPSGDLREMALERSLIAVGRPPAPAPDGYQTDTLNRPGGGGVAREFR